jgi:hypothetical protein
MFGSKEKEVIVGWRKLCIVELQILYGLPNIVRRMRWMRRRRIRFSFKICALDNNGVKGLATFTWQKMGSSGGLSSTLHKVLCCIKTLC